MAAPRNTPRNTPRIVSGRRRDAAVRELCSHLFADPARLVQTLTHQIEARFEIAPHTHDDVLQFDLLVGCAGRVWAQGRSHAIAGTTALVSPPGDTHGYTLEPGDGPSRVYHFKLRVEPGWGAVKQRAWPAALVDVGAAEPLRAALRAVMRLGVVERLRPPLLMVRVAEVLCLWPTARGQAERATLGTAAGDDDAQQERRMAAAVALIDARLADPPDLDELAQAAHYSPRHFARRFRRLYGCTPHTYLTAKRFALARQMLTEDRLRITHIADRLGFGSVATFSRWFSQQAGVSPTDYRQDPTVM